MTYYDDLTNDKKRVNSFKRAIYEKTSGITYDLGTGSGILAQLAANHAKKVYALEQNPFIIKSTKKNLSKYDNIELIKTDASRYEFPEKADTIICEMLDTALIDEEQVPVINNAHKYIKEDTVFIPKSVYSTVEIISTNINHITYYEDNIPEYISLSDEIKYHSISFQDVICEKVNVEISINIMKAGKINALKLTTYTILTDNIILEPTPMLNPPIIVPVDCMDVDVDDEIIINMEYIMGGGLNTLKTNIRRNK